MNFEDEYGAQQSYATRKDYRVCILLKYIYIGCADICFWWTVWNIADHLWPMDITTDGALSYLRGYSSIMSANLFYLFIRIVFGKLFDRYYEKHDRLVYPTVIITQSKIIKNKPLKFKMLKCIFPICIYFLVVGFIQVWRGLFATFDYVIELLFTKYKLNRIMTSMLFQFIVGFTLAFTLKNNAVNLCPTHKLYKYDELQYVDALFNLHIFDNLKILKKSTVTKGAVNAPGRNCEEDSFDEMLTLASSVRRPSAMKTNIVNHEFDFVMFATSRLVGHLHRSRIGKLPQPTTRIQSAERFGELIEENERNAEDRTRNGITYVKPLNTDKRFDSETCSFESKDNHFGPIFTVEKYHDRKVNRATILNADSTDKRYSAAFPKNELVSKSTEVKKENKIINKFKLKPPSKRVSVLRKLSRINQERPQHVVLKNNYTYENTEGKQNTILILVQPFDKNESTTNSISNDNNTNNISNDNNTNNIGNDNNTNNDCNYNNNNTNNNTTTNNNSKNKSNEEAPIENVSIAHTSISSGERFCILALGYLYTIHHRQIFLHIFGGMFWFTTWKLFDFATESFFTKTASDVPGLALIAMFCHCINHLALFRFLETASNINWITLCEFFCGILTVCLWASVWYILNIVAMAINQKLILYIVLNFISFGALAVKGLSINMAL